MRSNHKPQITNHKLRGFTLLELLVVIGIIAILVAFATVSYGAAQVRARDSRRKADLKSMQDALEQYYSANTFVYPVTCNTATTYLSSNWPVDPASYTYTEACTATSYCICARLETGSGGNSSNTTCNWTGNDAYFCVANLQ